MSVSLTCDVGHSGHVNDQQAHARCAECLNLCTVQVQRAVSARVRLLKFTHCTTGIECDMIIGQCRDLLNDQLMG